MKRIPMFELSVVVILRCMLMSRLLIRIRNLTLRKLKEKRLLKRSLFTQFLGGLLFRKRQISDEVKKEVVEKLAIMRIEVKEFSSQVVDRDGKYETGVVTVSPVNLNKIWGRRLGLAKLKLSCSIFIFYFFLFPHKVRCFPFLHKPRKSVPFLALLDRGSPEKKKISVISIFLLDGTSMFF